MPEGEGDDRHLRITGGLRFGSVDVSVLSVQKQGHRLTILPVF